MFRLSCFLRLGSSGCGLTRLCCCNFGSVFKRPLLFLRNKPWLLSLGGPCRCGHSGRHLVAAGRFSEADLQKCVDRCVPSPLEVFGCEPCVGDLRASFSARLPGPLCQRIASGAAAANGQLPGLFPLAASYTAAASLGVLEPLDLAAAFPEGPGFAPFFEDPDWVVELATALPFRELLRYTVSRRAATSTCSRAAPTRLG